MIPADTHTLVIGASIAGLASAACLRKNNIPFVIIEKQDEVAAPWRSHYDRLHLHTTKNGSHLPYTRFSPLVPRYPSRLQVIEYLESYQREFDIQPLFKTEAISVSRNQDHWLTKTNKGSIRSKYIIMATGVYGQPRSIHFKGIETFPGKIIHSKNFKTGKDFNSQRVLVVGFGNSACEIAIDLFEAGAEVAMSVRSPVNVIPRDVLGIPVLKLSLFMNSLPPRFADAISAPLVNLIIGDIRKLGLKRLPYGPLEEIRNEGKIPLLDIGTIQHIRKGDIKIYGEIDQVAGDTLKFKSGEHAQFDAIVAGIGYERDTTKILNVEQSRLDDLKVSIDRQKYFGKDGLYFCGFWLSPTGQFREIALDAKKIAKDISKKKAQE
jgi:indole-3-pyruvate monooxygenase